MIRTGQQIVSDFISLLRGTGIGSIINGGIYRSGLRPRDSRKEDLVVVYTSADPLQMQAGVVTINIFVPDINYGAGNGVLVEDSARCEALEIALQQAIKSLTADQSNYLIRLRDAVHTQRDESVPQSFVVARINFKYFDNQ